MRRFTLFVLLLLAMAAVVPAQDTGDYVEPQKEKKEPRPLKDRIWFGGGIGLNFGTVTAIQVAPMVGYFLDQKKKVSTGLGITYTYYRDNRYIPAYTTNLYGYRVFARYRPISQFYVHGEFLHLNAARYSYVDQTDMRIWIPHILLGGGYVQSLGGRSSIYLQVLFDVLQDPNSLYAGQPLFSGGVGIGF